MVRLSHAPFPQRVTTFLIILGGMWLPLAIPIYLLVPDANTVTILAMSLLVLDFLLLLTLWGRWIDRQSLFQRYGLVLTRQNGLDLLQGIAIGSLSLLSLFIFQGMMGWLLWRSPSPQLPRFILEGLVVGLGVGIGEELCFRGWLLDELQRSYKPAIALWANSLAFACLHFIKPVAEVLRTMPQFMGLLLLGFTLVWAKRRCCGRLGLSIGLHAGLVWGFYILDVGELTDYTRQVPVWITGMNDNPLAGIIGLLFLGGLALWMQGRSPTI